MRAHDEPLLTVDAHGQVVGWSVAAEHLFGRTAAHVLGSSVFEVVGSLARGRAWRIVPLVEEPRERTWGVWQDKDEGSDRRRERGPFESG